MFPTFRQFTSLSATNMPKEMRETYDTESPIEAWCLNAKHRDISVSVRGQSSTALDTLHEGTTVKSDKSTSCSVQLFRHLEMKVGRKRTEV